MACVSYEDVGDRVIPDIRLGRPNTAPETTAVSPERELNLLPGTLVEELRLERRPHKICWLFWQRFFSRPPVHKNSHRWGFRRAL